MRPIVRLFAATILCLAACGKSSNGTTASQSAGSYGSTPTSPGGSTGTPSGGTTIDADPSLAYIPDNLTVAVGTTVSFMFGSVAHTVHWVVAGGPADIPATSNATVTRDFPTAGSYSFVCTIHPYMNGTIVVQ